MLIPRRTGLVAWAVLGLAGTASANTLTDVGVGEPPHFDPHNGTTWTMSSTCVDINEAGEAACQGRAVGPTYRCGFRGSRRCSSKVDKVYRWNGTDLVGLSAPGQTNDTPLVINNLGEVAGYDYQGAVFPSGGGNGRIWRDGGPPDELPTIVVSLNDAGDYVLENLDVVGGVSYYSGTVHRADGSEVPFPGDPLRPFVVGNGGEVIGGQVLQAYVPDWSSPTGDTIPEVSGVGWLLDAAKVDAISRNPDGLLDLDGRLLWPAPFYRDRATAYSSFETRAHDVNDHGDFVVQIRYGGLYSGLYCTREGETRVRGTNGAVHVVPWACKGTNYTRGTYAGGKAFVGINNHGDAVGAFTPGVYTYQTSYPTFPHAWLRNETGGWDEYDVNDLLPPGTGYTVISVRDINDQRQIVGTCETPEGVLHGCIVDVATPAIPVDSVRPFVRIDAPARRSVLSSPTTVAATVWDDWSRVRRVVFRLDRARLGVVREPPYEVELDPARFAPGRHVLKVIAWDRAGNRKVARRLVEIAP